MSDQHYIEIFGPDENGEPEWDIIHPESCPKSTHGGGDYEYEDYDCDIGKMASEAGLDAFGGWDSKWPEGIPKNKPGRYPIGYWSESGYNWEFGAMEYDAGLMVDTEELIDGPKK